jgi:surfactin synthase thioesterase subunit
MSCWVPSILVIATSCTSVSSAQLVRRDAVVSANSEAAMVDGGSNLALSMYRVEQDQIVAKGKLGGASACELRQRVAEVRQAWQRAFALVAMAMPLHARLRAEAVKDCPDAALVQALVVELNGVLAQIYAEVEAGRKRMERR